MLVMDVSTLVIGSVLSSRGAWGSWLMYKWVVLSAATPILPFGFELDSWLFVVFILPISMPVKLSFIGSKGSKNLMGFT
jgi:hypothetical protein